MTLEIDCLVIGAGVVGLAVARALAIAGREVVLVEKTAQWGSETSSRNSEVIHAGIYHPPGSLKARLCVRGRQALYDYCRERAIPHRAIGKLIVAVDAEEIPILKQYQARAIANGVLDLVWMEAPALQRLEPAVRGVAALHSPSTGILDSHAYMSQLLRDFEMAGGIYLPHTPVLHGQVCGHGTTLQLGDKAATRVIARSVVNAAGLYAPSLARQINGLSPQTLPQAYYGAGHYYALTCASPFRHLVYPVAPPGALGIHVTLDLQGQVRFGPDLSWRSSINYRFDESRRSHFLDEIRRYYPDIRSDQLSPAFVGIRPKIGGPAAPDQDFRVFSHFADAQKCFISLFGIESPGLTASLALGEMVCNQLMRGHPHGMGLLGSK